MSVKQFCCLVAIAVGLVVLTNSVSFAQEEAVAEAVATAEPTKKDSKSTAVRPLTVATGLVDDTVITGTLMDSTSIEVRTAFGEATIPLSEVAGIRFPGDEDVSTTVVMLNGDSITGATDLKYASVETTWGSAKINGQNIATMLFVPGLRWESAQELGGKRWKLVEATAPKSVQPATGTLPQRNSNPAPIIRQGQPIGQPFRQ